METEGLSILTTAKYILEGIWNDQNGCPVCHILCASNSKNQIIRSFKKNRKRLFDGFRVSRDGEVLFTFPNQEIEMKLCA